jgi:hypothetical protein
MLEGGGSVGLVWPQDKINPVWVWRLRGGNNPDFPGHYADRAERAFDSPRAFAHSMGAKIDEEYEESLLPQYPVPRRREAVMATRMKL